MTPKSKLLLAVSVAAFALGHVPGFRDFGYGLLKPFGAVMFIVFYITLVLGKEIALFDAEHPHPGHAATAPKQRPHSSAAAARPEALAQRPS